jgi:hypothetical protein
VEYVVVIATDPSSLSSQVNNLISNGWRPQGGLALTQVKNDVEDDEPYETQWAQAMVKDGGSLESEVLTGAPARTSLAESEPSASRAS